MKPKRREQIDESHALLKANLYPENHVYRRKIDEAFLISEFPSDAIDCIQEMFNAWEHSMPFSILAIYESQFSIEENLENDWLAKEVARMAKHLLNYPKLAYVNYPCYQGDYRQAIINFDDILKVDEYRAFWWDFDEGTKDTDIYLTQLKMEFKDQLKEEVELELKEQLKQEVKAELMQEVKLRLTDQLKQDVKGQLKDQLKHEVKVELKEQLKQDVKMELKDQLKLEVKAELKDQLKHEVKRELKEQVKPELKQELQQDLGDTLRNMVGQQVKNATDELIATFEGAKRKLRNSLRRLIVTEIKREYD